MSIEFWKPEEIEAESFRRISEELGDRCFPAGIDLVVKRVIHTTADFSFADTLLFSEGVVETGKEAIRQGACIVTDTNMALAGINKARQRRDACPRLRRYGALLHGGGGCGRRG